MVQEDCNAAWLQPRAPREGPHRKAVRAMYQEETGGGHDHEAD